MTDYYIFKFHDGTYLMQCVSGTSGTRYIKTGKPEQAMKFGDNGLPDYLFDFTGKLVTVTKGAPTDEL